MMAFGAFQQGRHQNAAMADINVTPMVDVMLVLLVIFILAAPVFTQALQLELPQVKVNAAVAPGETVTVALDADGRLFWNNQAVTPTMLEVRLAQAAQQVTPPQLQLRIDKHTPYEAVAQLMAAAQSHGLRRLGFITDPAPPYLIEKN